MPYRSIRFVGSLCLTTAVVAISCRDTTDKSGPTTALGPVRGAAAARPSARMTGAQLHTANKYDWVGQAHNLAVRAMSTEWRKKKGNLKAACAAMEAWVDSSRAFTELLPPAHRGQKGVMKSSIRYSQTCLGRKVLVRGASAPVTLEEYDPSPEAEAAIADIETAIDNASDPEDLAGDLTSIYNASLSMNEADAAYVQTAISVTQSSAENAYGEGGQEAIEDAEEVYGQCALGKHGGANA